MHEFKDEINYKNFFKFDNELVKQKFWANLPKASRSVYPVILVHCNPKGIAFPGQQTIAILSGRTEKTAREGIKGLEGFPGFKAYKILTGRGHRSFRYEINATPDKKGRSFALYKCLFTGGHWCQLSPCSHSLYIVMRTFAFFDGELYCELEDLEEVNSYNVKLLIETGVYQQRNYDFVNADMDVLAEYAGISSDRGLRDAFNNLEENHLIEPTVPFDGQDTWKIFRIPPLLFPPSFLNESVKKRYANRSSINSN